MAKKSKARTIDSLVIHEDVEMFSGRVLEGIYIGLSPKGSKGTVNAWCVLKSKVARRLEDHFKTIAEQLESEGK